MTTEPYRHPSLLQLEEGLERVDVTEEEVERQRRGRTSENPCLYRGGVDHLTKEGHVSDGPTPVPFPVATVLPRLRDLLRRWGKWDTDLGPFSHWLVYITPTDWIPLEVT